MTNAQSSPQPIESLVDKLNVDVENDVVARVSYQDGASRKMPEWVAKELRQYLRGCRKVFEFPYKLQGTAFERLVYEAAMSIPYGETRSYGWVANAIGRPNAARAVGNALNKNPLMLVVPCHRVVASGGIGGFGCGIELKRALLDLELRHR